MDLTWTRVLALAMVAVGLVVTADLARADAVTIDDVPAYDWYHGCAPTAAGSVFGYWDYAGYSKLFTASGSDLFLTSKVKDQISSPAHNAKYDPKPDNTTLPVPTKTSIAGFMGTSVDPLGYGSTYISKIDDGLRDYASYRGYTFNAWHEYYGSSLSWLDLTTEIDAGRPMMFAVDSSGNGTVDHSIPVLGYDDRGSGGKWYGYYTTWSESETIVWSQFRGLSSSYSWGVYNGTFVQPVSAIPEPTSIALLGMGLFGMAWIRRRRTA